MNLNKLINELSDQPFKYGSTDCYQFTARLVKEYHGADYIKLHVVYKNKKEAAEYMARHGGIEALTTGTLGYPLKDVREGLTGDVVSATVTPGEVALGFVVNGYGLFKTAKRVAKIPLKKCRLGWRIK